MRTIRPTAQQPNSSINTMKANIIVTISIGSLLLSVSAKAANLIVNGDFTTSNGANNTPYIDPAGNWTTSGHAFYHYNDNNMGTGNYVYVWSNSGGSVDQDVSAAWTTADTITISLVTAINSSWGNGLGSLLVELRKASDDSVLWDNTTSGIDSTVTPLSWSIDAGTLAATAGEDLNLKITAIGQGAMIDDVSLEVIPEPSSLALLCLGGLALLRRRRQAIAPPANLPQRQ